MAAGDVAFKAPIDASGSPHPNTHFLMQDCGPLVAWGSAPFAPLVQPERKHYGDAGPGRYCQRPPLGRVVSNSVRLEHMFRGEGPQEEQYWYVREGV